VAAVDVAPPAGGDEVTEELNQAILQLALSGLTGAEHQLHIVHAWTVYGESILASPRVRFKREELDALVEAEHAMRRTNVEGLLERFRSGLSSAHADRFNPEVHLIKGDPKSAISEAVQRLDADILVMGSKCRSGPSGLILGNTAEEILHRLECSVAVVKPGDFVSPVSVA
jgi:nucleotide-binding universal stress UspA family protein